MNKMKMVEIKNALILDYIQLGAVLWAYACACVFVFLAE